MCRGRLGRLGDAYCKIGDKVQLVGDDLFVTNVKFLAKRDRRKICQLHLGKGKPDRNLDRNFERHQQWPTKQDLLAVMSHRSGETEDSTIADLAVAVTADKSKQVLLPVLIGWLSTINCFESKNNWANQRFSQRRNFSSSAS
jgi:hypothetical protein